MPSSLSQRIRFVAKITGGLFLTDAKRSVSIRVWQLLLRFTWELPQTIVGWAYSVMRAVVGQVDRVDTFGDITFE